MSRTPETVWRETGQSVVEPITSGEVALVSGNSTTRNGTQSMPGGTSSLATASGVGLVGSLPSARWLAPDPRQSLPRSQPNKVRWRWDGPEPESLPGVVVWL